MRRIASVFKRSDKNKDKAKGSTTPAIEEQPASVPVSLSSPSRLSTLSRTTSKKGRLSSSKITVSTVPPPLPALDAHHSSSSSSTGSASLQTPDDTHSDRHSHLKSWVPWAQQSPMSSTSLGLGWPESAAPSRSSRAVSEDDVSVHSSGEEELGPVEYFATLTSQRLESTLSAPPLLHTPDSPLFPRSVNALVILDPAPSLATSMHRARLLERLNKRDLSQADRVAFQAFGSRPAAKAVRRNRRRQIDEGARYDLSQLSRASHGLRRWIERPYFEERVTLWQTDIATGNAVQSPVKGSGFAVPALDVSPALEILADDVDAVTPTLAPSPSTVSSPAAPATPASVSTPNLARPDKYTPYKATPSPLRQNANSSTPSFMASSPSSSVPSASPILPSPALAESLPSSSSTSTIIMPSVVVLSPTPEPSPSNTSKRGVRFTPSVKSVERVPSEYAERVAKQKAEKARFLKEENERRHHEAERARHEEERQRWEHERQAWEREKKAIEEERRRKTYADEVAAARARREHMNLPTPHRNAAAAALSETYTRPVYDERRQSSGSTHPPSTRSPSVRSPAPRSVSTSRAPSSVASGAADERAARMSRRQSAVSESSFRGSTSSNFGYAVPPVPPVPMMPAYGMPVAVSMPMMVTQAQAQMMMSMGRMNMGMVPMMQQQEMAMPLLPPNAPFMMHSNGSRSRSASGPRDGSRERVPSNAGRSSGSGNSSPNASTERLAMANRGRSNHRISSVGSSSHEAQARTQVRASSTHGSARGPAPATHSHSHAPRPPVLQQSSWGGAGARSQPPHSAPIPRRQTAFS